MESPYQLLPGGYITWRTRLPDEQVWQAFGGQRGKPTVRRLEAGAPRLSREWVDSHPTKGRPDVTDIVSEKQLLKNARDASKLARRSAERYGEALRADIGGILESLAPKPPPSRDDILILLEKLANDEAFWKEFTNKKNTAKQLKAHNIDPTGLKLPKKFPEPDEYRTALEALRRGRGVRASIRPARDWRGAGLARDVREFGMFGMTG